MATLRIPVIALIGVALSSLPHALSAQAMSSLQQFWHAGRRDNYAAATAAGKQAAAHAGYAAVRIEGCVLTAPDPGTVPLYQFWSAGRGDNFATTTNILGKGMTNPAGYTLVRIEGYVYSEARKGTVPLNLYYNTQRGDNFTTATPEGAESARRSGYALVAIQGYIPAAGSCQ
ncbi:MAG TPA: hypothetical protein VGI92_12680 [Gemmatimonadales bacterium]|jgi:hypothetical protein